MKIPGLYNENAIRQLLFLFTALLHIALLVFVVIPAGKKLMNDEPVAGIMKLVDVEEDIPPPPVIQRPPEVFTNTVEAVAETMIETDDVSDLIIILEPVYTEPLEIEYLSMGRISHNPELPEDEIRRATVYPPIAQRSGIEGTVYLELFIDAQGNIRNVSLIRETPEGRGFGEAAINAILSVQARGIQAVPAKADGRDVAVRYRYPITFRLR